jgi:tetratricopeptide (TPR) repeat protein
MSAACRKFTPHRRRKARPGTVSAPCLTAIGGSLREAWGADDLGRHFAASALKEVHAGGVTAIAGLWTWLPIVNWAAARPSGEERPPQVELPIVSGSIPPSAIAHVARGDTGFSLVSVLPGETVVLVPAAGTATGSGSGGLSGTGKTCLAVAAVGTLAREAGLRVVVWVTATGRDAVVSGYARALRDVGVRTPAASAEEAAARFLAWLERADQPWLVVLDDLRDGSVLGDLRPRGPAGWVLITTEHSGTAGEVDNSRVVPVGPLSPREALTLLTSRGDNDASHRTGALELASDLEFQPIALGQALAVMTALGIGCGEYHSRLAGKRRRAQGLPAAGKQTLVAAWSVSAEVANLLAPAGLAGRALALVSVLAPHGIPGAVLATDAACEFVTGCPGASAASRSETSAAVRNLARAGLASVDPDSVACTVLVHPLVQAITRELLPAAESKSAASAAAAALAEAWSQPDMPPLVAQRLRDCTARLHKLASPLLWVPNCHPALLQAGQSLDTSGMDGLAADYWQAMLAVSQQALGARHPRTIMIESQFVAACEAAGLLHKEVAVHEQTLAQLADKLPVGHPDIAAARIRLARGYSATGRNADAALVAEGALADFRSMAGPPADVLAAQERLARTYFGAGQLKEAVETYQQVLAGRDQILGPEHPQTIASCSALASAHRASGRFKEAITLAERALASSERVLGTDHADTLAARAHLAAAYHGAKKMKASVSLYERTLAERERVQGADHPDTISARGDLAAAYQSAGKLGQAVSLYEQALAACRRVFGPNHRLTRAARDDLNAAAAHGLAVRGIDLRSPRRDQPLA